MGRITLFSNAQPAADLRFHFKTDIVMCFLADFTSFQSIVVNSLQDLDCESIHSLLGHSQWVRELVTAYLELYFQHSLCEGKHMRLCSETDGKFRLKGFFVSSDICLRRD